MSPRSLKSRVVAVVGTGVIGRSWMRVFARAGLEARVWDPDPSQVERAWEWYKQDLKRLRKQFGLGKAEVRQERSGVVRCATLEEALAGAVYVQECGPERLDVKRDLFAALDARADARAILASSTSTLNLSLIVEGLSGAARCVVAHPVNPPHLIPAVEVIGGVATDPHVVRRAIRLLFRVGQSPVLVRRFASGFLIDRMQAALLREAVQLVTEGVAGVEAVEAVIRDGLGMRWALLGPFGVANTDADGGLREYFHRDRASLEALWEDLRAHPFPSEAVIERLGHATDIMYRRVPRPSQREWRDDMLSRLRRLKGSYPLGGESEE